MDHFTLFAVIADTLLTDINTSQNDWFRNFI